MVPTSARVLELNMETLQHKIATLIGLLRRMT